MHKTIAVILAVATLALAVLPSEAATLHPAPQAAALTYTTMAFPPSQELASTQVLSGTQPITGTLRITRLIAAYFGLTADEILDLRSQDLGWGEIARMLFINSQTGVPVEDILEMRQQGLGWGEIRLSLGLHPGMPHMSLGTIISRGRGPTKDRGEWVPPGQAKKEGKWKKP